MKQNERRMKKVPGNLDDGEYVLCIIKDNNILGSTTLLIKEGMKEEFYVSELTY